MAGTIYELVADRRERPVEPLLGNLGPRTQGRVNDARTRLKGSEVSVLDNAPKKAPQPASGPTYLAAQERGR